MSRLAIKSGLPQFFLYRVSDLCMSQMLFSLSLVYHSFPLQRRLLIYRSDLTFLLIIDSPFSHPDWSPQMLARWSMPVKINW